MDPTSSGTNSPDLSGSFENIDFTDFGGSEDEHQARDYINQFYGRNVKVSTEGAATDTGDIPQKTRNGLSGKKALRFVSKLLNPLATFKNLNSSNIGSVENEDRQVSGSADPAASRDEDGWEIVDFSSTDITLSVAGKEGGKYIFADDDVLVGALGQSAFSRSPATEETLFKSGRPLLKEMSQSDHRNTCPLHSVLAAYLNSDKASGVIEKMFQEENSGFVAVTLDDPNVQSVTTVVSKSRVFINDSELFSSSSADSIWITAAEKAFLAANLADKQLYKEACQEQLASSLMNQIRGRLRHSLDENDNPRFDYVDPFWVLYRLPAVDFGVKYASCEPQEIIFEANYKESDSKKKLWEQHQKSLSACLSLEVPIIVCTRKVESESDWRSKIRVGFTAMKTGTPTGHAMAVIKAHAVDGVEGILVYDPAGEKKGSITESMLTDENFKPDKNSALQFIAWDRVPSRFTMAYLARGAPLLRNRVG